MSSFIKLLKNGLQNNSKILVGLGGFEPPTSPLSGVRSNQLSYRPICVFRNHCRLYVLKIYRIK